MKIHGVAPHPLSTWTGLGPDVKVLALDLLLMGDMRHTQEATVFRTLMQAPIRARKGFLAVVVGMEEPWNAGMVRLPRRASWSGRRRRRRRRRLRFGQQGQLAAKEGAEWVWEATWWKILGLVPAGELEEEHTTAVVRGPE